MESDLEGAARIGDRIYWISSHGRDGKGRKSQNRQRFFATCCATSEPIPVSVRLGSTNGRGRARNRDASRASILQSVAFARTGWSLDRLADLEDTRGRIFAAANQRYEPPTLVLFSDRVESACGSASAATGPFYCPGDRKVYLDLSFFRELDQRFGAPGDFAQAYVVAHEVGHHVQNLTGVNAQVSRLQSRASEAEGHALSVRLELQADCYAGVWANHAGQRLLQEGDIDEGLNAAAAIGDDRLLRVAGRRSSPESFTHGTSAQRAQWLRTGLASGRIDSCDTFRSNSS